MKVKILTLTILIGIGLTLSVFVWAQDNQILVNPDFADNPGYDNVNNWYFHSWDWYFLSQWQGGSGHGGDAGLGHLSNYYNAGDTKSVWFRQAVTVTADTYWGSCWVRDNTSSLSGDPGYNCPASSNYAIWWVVESSDLNMLCSTASSPGDCDFGQALNWGKIDTVGTGWEEVEIDFSTAETETLYLSFYGWGPYSNNCTYHQVDDCYIYGGAVPTATVQPPPPLDCNLENYSFDDELEGWDYGDWVTWDDDGYVELHQCTDQLDSYISQPITLTATGPSDHYEISISARAPYPVSPGSEPLVRWKLNSLIPGNSPNWYGDQMHIFFDEWWQHSSSYLRENNSPAISDTLTIWTANNDVQIDSVCVTLHSGPATMTPACPISPTYTPEPTYTPLPTPTPVTTATATAWAATATAWATQEAYPTQPAPSCQSYSSNEPGWDFMWLAGQILMFLAAFFEAVFRLLGTILQPLFDFFGFIIWLAGATFSLVASIIDLLAAALQFLFSFIGLFFDILEMIGAFILALWNVLSISPTDPGVEIPTYFAWGIAVLDFLIEGTPLEYLEPIAMALASLLIIRWTVKQFSDWGG